MSNGKKILDGLKDALAQNVARYTNIYTADVGIEEGRMTDLERARRDLERVDMLVPNQCHNRSEVVSWLAEAIAAARREGAEERADWISPADFETSIRLAIAQGAEEMRERAAQVCDLEDCVRIKASALAADIRALPLTPEEPTRSKFVLRGIRGL